MPAYWIAHVTVKDPQQYQHYMDLAPQAFRQFNARFLARGEQAQTLEGPSFVKHVLIEFDDYATALALLPFAGLSVGETTAAPRGGSHDYHRRRLAARPLKSPRRYAEAG